jgi:CBS domain-containing protein
VEGNTVPLPVSTTVGAARAFLDKQQCNSWPAGDKNFVVTVVNRRDLETARDDQVLRDLIQADSHFPYVHSDHPVSYALERMREGGVDVLPVVSRASIHEICGVIGLREILAAYGVPDSAFFARSTPV